MQCSPSSERIYSSITLNQINDYPRFEIKAHTSDEKEFTYHGTAIHRKCHLIAVNCSFRPTQINRYDQSNMVRGCWLHAITSSNRIGLRVEYNLSKDFKDPNYHKVVSIYEGERKLASFNYLKEYTEVRDEDGILSRFHHKDGTLTLMEYFDKEDRLYRQERYVWENGSLALKENLDGNNEVVCSKRFTYDDHNNLIAQIISKGKKILRNGTAITKNTCSSKSGKIVV